MRVIVHPECPMAVVDAADASGSTDYIRRAIEGATEPTTFAIGTEVNLVQRLAAANPQHEIFCLDPVVCPCSTMYRIHPGYLAWVLEALVAGDMRNRITVPDSVAEPARVALRRMLAADHRLDELRDRKPWSSSPRIAGLVAALHATAAGSRVTLVTKDVLVRTNTRFAQGGIAAVMFDDDRVDDHIRDTLVAGAGTVRDPVAVRVLAEEGPARIRELVAAGVAFDRADDGAWLKGLKAAHSYPRASCTRAATQPVPRSSTPSSPGCGRARCGWSSTRSWLTSSCEAAEWPVASSSASASSIPSCAERRRIARRRIILRVRTLRSADLLRSEPRASARARSVTEHARARASGSMRMPSSSLPAARASCTHARRTRRSRQVTGSPRHCARVPRRRTWSSSSSTRRFWPPASPSSCPRPCEVRAPCFATSPGGALSQDVHPDVELAPRDVVSRGVAEAMRRQGGPVLLDATAVHSTDAAERAAFLARKDYRRSTRPCAPGGWTGLSSRSP